MEDSSLDSYVRDNLSLGHPPGKIRKALIDAGWGAGEVDRAISEALPNVPAAKRRRKASRMKKPPSRASRRKGIMRYADIIIRPSAFFDDIGREKGFRNPLIFYAILTFVHLLALNLYIFTAFSLNPMLLDPGLGFGALLIYISSNFLLANVSVIVTVFLSFVAAGYFHIFASVFGGKGSYLDTYKVMVYSSAPSIIIWLIAPAAVLSPLIVTAAALLIYAWISVIQIIGLSRLHRINMKRTLIMFAIIVLVSLGILLLILAILFAVFLAPVLLQGDHPFILYSSSCRDRTDARISLVNAGMGTVYLTGCTEPGSVRGTSAECGQFSIERTDGGRMDGSFSSETIDSVVSVRTGVSTFTDECTSLGNPTTCEYVFTQANEEPKTVEVFCPG